MPLLRALGVRQSGMENCHFISKHLMQIRRDRRSQTNFRNQQN